MKGPFSGIFKKSENETGAKAPSQINSRAIRELEEDQREMIRGVVELSGTTVKEVMVPRTDTVFLSAAAPKDELLALIADSGHSRFPVYEETIDKVIGILYVKDVLKALVRDSAHSAAQSAAHSADQNMAHNEDRETGHHEVFDIKALVRKPFFVPVSKHIDDLLRELRRRRVHIAVVVDEYGGVSGIVCMEDIIEEIVGDIQDEFDNETEDVLQLGEGIWLCDARVSLKDLAQKTGLDLPADDFDTLGGFVFDLFGKIPVKYEKIEYNGNDFIIQEMDGHKINLVKIVLPREGS
jgi:CBS domain containing-hemolysin-like protein